MTRKTTEEKKQANKTSAKSGGALAREKDCSIAQELVAEIMSMTEEEVQLIIRLLASSQNE